MQAKSAPSFAAPPGFVAEAGTSLIPARVAPQVIPPATPAAVAASPAPRRATPVAAVPASVGRPATGSAFPVPAAVAVPTPMPAPRVAQSGPPDLTRSMGAGAGPAAAGSAGAAGAGAVAQRFSVPAGPAPETFPAPLADGEIVVRPLPAQPPLPLQRRGMPWMEQE